jgi:carboxyl-terminal processing protease
MPAQERRSYAGIGVSLTLDGDRGPPIVREVFPSSPAATAGVRVGDTILAIDDRPTERMTLGEAVQAIRGVEGTSVVLQLRAPNDSRAGDVRVRRASLELPLVQTERKGQAEYIRVRSFQDGVTDLIRADLDQSAGDGASAWIIDLRGNSGGNLLEVARTASLFVGDAIIGVRVGRAQERVAIRGTGAPVAPRLPVLVLVDRDTGSGAELLASALREKDVARLLGTRTSGRVGVASVVPLPNGAVAQITSQRMLSAAGERLDGVGVEPDVVVETSVADWMQGRDPQLERALAQLQELIAGR